MSFKQVGLYPANPTTARGVSTKISAYKSKVIYPNGKTIIIHDLQNPSLATVYTNHAHNTTIARFSPSGYYCASADTSGTVKIWDTVGEDQTLKGEYKVISGRINDLEWDGESKRIIAVGQGREKFGHAFMTDTGTSCGEIAGHSKVINAVSIRQQRPFRAVTAADDNTIVFYHGAPFKYEKMIRTHTRFIQDVRYAPSGDHFASVGSDSKVFLYDGKTGDTLTELSDGAHKGTIMACSWSSNSKFLTTSSLDRTVKLWDVETKKAITTWTLGTAINDQQVGVVWSGPEEIVSLSLSGTLNVFDKRNSSEKPLRVLNRPQKPVTAFAPTSSDTFLAGTADGRVLSYSVPEKTVTVIEGDNHATLVTGLAAVPGGKTLSIGYDDKVREVQGLTYVPASCPTTSQPKSIGGASDGTVFVAEVANVEAIRNNQKVFDLRTKFTPCSIAASKSVVAVGAEDSKVYLYDWDGKSLKETGVLEGSRGQVSALAFSPDGSKLAAGDSSGRMALFNMADKKVITTKWSFHTARINSLSWTADSKHCASGSLDTHVYVWSVDTPEKNIPILHAGPGGVNAVLWIGAPGTLVSSGADGCVRVWEIKFQ